MTSPDADIRRKLALSLPRARGIDPPADSKPGEGWYPKEQETEARMQPSPEWIGPKAGQGWYAKEQQTQAVVPSPAYVGPRPHLRLPHRLNASGQLTDPVNPFQGHRDK